MMTRDVCAARGHQVMPGETPVRPGRRQLRIAEHGLIGDLHTVALVGTDRTIDGEIPDKVDTLGPRRPGSQELAGRRSCP